MSRLQTEREEDAGTLAASTTPITTTTGGFVLFALFGSVQALFGPSLPGMRAAFHVSAGDAGVVISAFFLGAALGIVLSGVAGTHVPLRGRLVLSGGLAVLGCVGLGTARVWPVAVTSVFVIGLGYGAIVVAFNTEFATGFGRRSPAMLNLLNAAFGSGAFVGPLLVGSLSTGFRLPFLLSGALVLCILPTVLTVPRRPAVAAHRSAHTGRAGQALLITFLVLFILYEGLEQDISGWEATQLVARGWSTGHAASATAFFWGALTLGRVLIAPVSVRVRADRIIIISLTVMVALMLLARIPALTAVAYTAAGLALASIFPLAFLWFARAFPDNDRVPSYALLTALCGGVVFPFLFGKLIGASTPEALPAGLAVTTVLALLVALRLHATAPLPGVRGEPSMLPDGASASSSTVNGTES